MIMAKLGRYRVVDLRTGRTFVLQGHGVDSVMKRLGRTDWERDQYEVTAEEEERSREVERRR